jgi:predicted O-methyltransferase YrrM
LTKGKEMMQHIEIKEQLKRTFDTHEGLTTFPEACFLYDLVVSLKGQGEIVEIGFWKGYSTVFLAKASQLSCKKVIYAIDPHVGSPEHQGQGRVWTFDIFRQNIQKAGVADMVSPIVKTSLEASASFHQPIELLFIDGLHEYEGVSDDCKAWLHKVIDGGFVAFHDFDTRPWPGVKKAVIEYIFRNKNFDQYRMMGSALSVRRVPRRRFLTSVFCRAFIFFDQWASKKNFPLRRISKVFQKMTKQLLDRY